MKSRGVTTAMDSPIIVENGIRSSVRISMAVHTRKISRPHTASNAKANATRFHLPEIGMVGQFPLGIDVVHRSAERTGFVWFLHRFSHRTFRAYRFLLSG